MDATGWDERYAASDLVWSAGPNRTVADEVGGLTAGTALDLGAGEGRNALWLAEQGWAVTAVDFSAVGLDKARAIARRQLNLFNADLDRQPRCRSNDVCGLQGASSSGFGFGHVDVKHSR